MEESSVFDDDITESLLEEVFGEVDSGVKQTNECEKSVATFLMEEHESDLNAVFGVKDKGINSNSKLSTSPKPGSEPREKDCNLLREELYISDEEDESGVHYPQFEKKTKWVKSDVVLKNDCSSQSNYYSDGTPKNGKKWTDLKSVHDMLNEKISKLDSPKGGYVGDPMVDPVLYMHIINPKVSSSVLKARMVGRESVSSGKIKKFLEAKDLKEVNWVTGGAIVGKVVTKSQKGNPYCIWNLSDLKGDIKIISVFLFGTAYKEFWKLPLGMVVGILNPVPLTNKTNKTEATLKVDNADKIMIFGTSKDYGTCKSKKMNGENCTSVVNKALCEYCIYHVKQVYDKASRRPELQSNFTGSGLVNLRNKVLGKDEVFYGGRLYTAVTTKKNSSTPKQEREREKMRMHSLEFDSSKTKKDRDLLQRLSGYNKVKGDNSIEGEKSVEVKGPRPNCAPSNNERGNLSQSKAQSSNLSCPKPDKMIDLDTPITNKQIIRAKANALRFIRQNGPLKKPSDKDRKRTPEQISSLKRRLESEERENKRVKTSSEGEKNGKDLVELKRERSGITKRFLDLMNSTPENVELLKEAENEEREKYFNRLEIREKMEEKMASTYKVDCKAVRCLKCNYKSFSASDLCKREKHPLKVVNAVKRFWKCGDCSARTVCLELVPLHSCKVCGSSKWERASMLPEKKVPSGKESLSIRGHEEKFIGSNVRNPNINLLVPDEAS